jgi:hypothetical protein
VQQRDVRFWREAVRSRNEWLWNERPWREADIVAGGMSNVTPADFYLNQTIVFRYRLGSKYLLAGVKSLMLAFAMKKSVVCCSQLVTVPSE